MPGSCEFRACTGDACCAEPVTDSHTCAPHRMGGRAGRWARVSIGGAACAPAGAPGPRGGQGLWLTGKALHLCFQITLHLRPESALISRAAAWSADRAAASACTLVRRLHAYIYTETTARAAVGQLTDLSGDGSSGTGNTVCAHGIAALVPAARHSAPGAIR